MSSSIWNKFNSAKGKREFLNAKDISRHLKCGICEDVFEDPVRTKCGHTFCFICLENWALVQKRCYRCKRSLRRRQAEKDLIAFNLIDDLPARCLHLECTWQGIYSLLKKHQRVCEFRPFKTLTPYANVFSLDEDHPTVIELDQGDQGDQDGTPQ